MSRATSLYFVGLVTLLIGVQAAYVSQGNHALAAHLAEEIHRCDDVRARIDAVDTRVRERVALLRQEFERTERVFPDPELAATENAHGAEVRE
jgi:hypothetical protein